MAIQIKMGILIWIATIIEKIIGVDFGERKIHDKNMNMHSPEVIVVQQYLWNPWSDPFPSKTEMANLLQ